MFGSYGIFLGQKQNDERCDPLFQKYDPYLKSWTLSHNKKEN